MTERVSVDVSFIGPSLFSRSWRWSNRLCQKPAIWLVQSIRGKRAELRGIMCLASFMRRSRTSPASFRTPRCFDTAGCETPTGLSGPHRLLALAAEAPEDRPTSRVGQRSEKECHGAGIVINNPLAIDLIVNQRDMYVKPKLGEVGSTGGEGLTFP
jgi:hypothetical protein